MAIDDVWRRIGTEVGFYYDLTFDSIPMVPGVYAWFYPLRVLSKDPNDLEKLVMQVQSLINYDSQGCGQGLKETEIPAGWVNWRLGARRVPRLFKLSPPFRNVWTEIAANEDLFLDFQQSLLKASVFMPPLYVGKADNLRARCRQHRDGSDQVNGFHRRFEEFARSEDLPIREVNRLIFACVKTTSVLGQEQNESISRVNEIVEAVMKSICAPPYGIK